MHNLYEYLTSPLVGFVLKIAALLATAGFGLMGVGVTTRDADGRLTRSGRVALAGVVVAATLSLATVVYDYAIQQRDAAIIQRRSEQLLMSVQRGLYPLRGATVEAIVRLGEFPALARVKARMRLLIDVDRNCTKRRTGVSCYGIGADGNAFIYDVEPSLAMEPGRDIVVHEVLKSLSVHVALYRSVTGPQASAGEAVAYVGRFFVDRRDGRGQMMLRYDRRAESVEVIFTVGVGNERLLESGTYSLVDVLPGFVRATPNVNREDLCERAKLDKSECDAAITPAYNGLSLNEMNISFEYPKQIRMTSNEETRCLAEDGNGTAMGLAVALPDVDSLDSLGNVPAEFRTRRPFACQVLTEAQARQNTAQRVRP
jgi:hypothetical protein